MVKDSVYQSDNFRILSRQRPIELFANFEDWHAGGVFACECVSSVCQAHLQCQCFSLLKAS